MYLGTPDSFKSGDVRKFLREFLSDGRVVEIPKLFGGFKWNHSISEAIEISKAINRFGLKKALLDGLFSTIG